MLYDTITWKDEVFQICMSEFNNSMHVNRESLLKLSTSESANILTIQFFNSLMVVDKLHLLSAAQNAINAWKGNYMRSKGLDVEIILYASAQHQIIRALELMGITDRTETIAVVILGEQSRRVKDCMLSLGDAIGEEITPPFHRNIKQLKALMKTFDISESEVSLFLQDHDETSWQHAVSKCLVSRISQVALS